MDRNARVAAARKWDREFGLELVGARRRALAAVVRSLEQPTLGDLLAFVGEQMCDIAETPEAGIVRLGDLIDGRDGEGPFVGDLLRSLGLDLADAMGSAAKLGLDLDAELTSFIESARPRLRVR